MFSICFTICLFISPDLDGRRAPKMKYPTICFDISSVLRVPFTWLSDSEDCEGKIAISEYGGSPPHTPTTKHCRANAHRRQLGIMAEPKTIEEFFGKLTKKVGARKPSHTTSLCITARAQPTLTEDKKRLSLAFLVFPGPARCKPAHTLCLTAAGIGCFHILLRDSKGDRCCTRRFGTASETVGSAIPRTRTHRMYDLASLSMNRYSCTVFCRWAWVYVMCCWTILTEEEK